MAKNKVVALDGAGVQPGAVPAEATDVLAVASGLSAEQAVLTEYEAIVAGFAGDDDFMFEVAQAERGADDVPAFAADLGATLTDPDLLARFEGVRENLMREMRGGMCTADQAYAYLENIEISLLLEQEAAVKA